jgi:hypothetical protein
LGRKKCGHLEDCLLFRHQTLTLPSKVPPHPPPTLGRKEGTEVEEEGRKEGTEVKEEGGEEMKE